MKAPPSPLCITNMAPEPPHIDLQVKWERLLGQMQAAAAAAGPSCDRAALLAVQALAPAARAVWRVADPLATLADGSPAPAEALLLQARECVCVMWWFTLGRPCVCGCLPGCARLLAVACGAAVCV